MRHRDRNRETESELTHLFKNNLSDISREFLYTSHAGSFFMWGVSLTHPVMASFFFFFYLRSFSHTSRTGFIFIWEVSLAHPMLVSFWSGEFLLHILCWLHLYLGSFSYTSALASFLCREFLIHIPCCLQFYARSFSYTFCAGFSFYLGSFSYSSHAGFTFYRWSFSYTSHAGFNFIWGVSLTHPIQIS